MELKQLYVKATGEPWGAPLEEKKKPPKESSSSTKQMDTRKADKARKVRYGSLKRRCYVQENDVTHH